MSKIGVVFNPEGRTYLYDSGPFKVRKGDLCVVVVHGEMKVVTVVCEGNTTGYTGPISPIRGVVKLDTDLLPNEVIPQYLPTSVYVVLASASVLALNYLIKYNFPFFQELFESVTR